MKRVFILVPASVLVSVVMLTSCEHSHNKGLPVSFNDEWQFIRQDSLNMENLLPGNIANHKWEEVTLPHTAFTEPAVVKEKQWTGICWYRKSFRAEKRLRHRQTALLFDGAMNDAIIYLNEAEIDRHTGGYLPFFVDITNDLKYGSENEILVRLDNRENPQIPPGKPLAELDFLYYSGLYRNVSLIIKDRLHITNAMEVDTLLGGGVITGFRNVSHDSATVTVSALVQNNDNTPRSFSLGNTLFDAAGNAAAGAKTETMEIEPGEHRRISMEMKVINPALWSPEQPFIYLLSTEILSEDRVIDRNETRIGIRTVEITPEKGLLINGEPVSITGTNRHQEYPYLGYALSDNANYRDAYKIREAGFNFVRCSHYPQAPAFLDACDELGILVMNSIPGWQFIGDSLFREASVYNTRQMCRRDRNHPSVILWESSLNETWMPYDFLKTLHQTVKNELPGGNNYTASWMDTICDVFIPARQHAKAPDYWKGYSKKKPLFISEYGDWEYYANNAGFSQTEFKDLAPEARNSRQLRSAGERALLQQAFNYQESHNDNLYGPAFGDANWLIFDYNRGYAPDIESSGIMDIFRLPKFAYWFYRSQSDESPVCFLASYNQHTPDNTVRIFSNADTVLLYRNDTLVAKQGPDRNLNTINLTHPPFTFITDGYKPGTLKAVGLRKGTEYAVHTVTTPGPPAAIRLSVDLGNKQLRADGSDAVFVYATLVDSLDNPVHVADSLIEFSVRGDAVLIGDNPARVEAGIATILLKAGTTAGKVMIRAKSGSMARAELMAETKK
ncbi:MAG TPA: glycoside hydrolase family 2 TIM barrel-domain containing protein [Bacteroidales bacterium]|nr:glycoside hydrolase family 2 TIM barrel-domain containing protein [Bacteroidales bacterium]